MRGGGISDLVAAKPLQVRNLLANKARSKIAIGNSHHFLSGSVDLRVPHGEKSQLWPLSPMTKVLADGASWNWKAFASFLLICVFQQITATLSKKQPIFICVKLLRFCNKKKELFA